MARASLTVWHWNLHCFGHYSWIWVDFLFVWLVACSVSWLFFVFVFFFPQYLLRMTLDLSGRSTHDLLFPTKVPCAVTRGIDSNSSQRQHQRLPISLTFNHFSWRHSFQICCITLVNVQDSKTVVFDNPIHFILFGEKICHSSSHR